MRIGLRVLSLTSVLVALTTIAGSCGLLMPEENPYGGQKWAMDRHEGCMSRLYGDLKQWNIEGSRLGCNLIIAVRVTDGSRSPETQAVLWVGGTSVVQAKIMRADSPSIFGQLVEITKTRSDLSDSELVQRLVVDATSLKPDRLVGLSHHIEAFRKLHVAVSPEPVVVPFSPKIEVWVQSWASVNYFRIWAPACPDTQANCSTSNPLHAWCVELFEMLHACESGIAEGKLRGQ